MLRCESCDIPAVRGRRKEENPAKAAKEQQPETEGETEDGKERVLRRG